MMNSFRDYFKNKGVIAIFTALLMAVLTKFFLPVFINLTSNFTDRLLHGPSANEKEIHRLILAADGKTVSGKTCKYLCDFASPETAFWELISQASPRDKQNLKIYSICFEKKHQSQDKLKEVKKLETEFKKNSTYEIFLKLRDELQIIEEFDKELFHNEYTKIESLVNIIDKNKQDTSSLIEKSTADFLLYCETKSDNCCSKVLSNYNKYLNKFKQSFTDINPKLFFDAKIQDCINKCINNRIAIITTQPTTPSTIPPPAQLDQNIVQLASTNKTKNISIDFDDKIQRTPDTSPIEGLLRIALQNKGFILGEPNNTTKNYTFFIKAGDVNSQQRNPDGFYTATFTIRCKQIQTPFTGTGKDTNRSQSLIDAQQSAAEGMANIIEKINRQDP